MRKLTDYSPQEIRSLLHDRGICVVIPTYNNAGTIQRVVTDALSLCEDVIVVDDGSTDGTTTQLKSITGITLVGYERNRGKGYALKMGFRRALQMGFAYAITMDADGQHYASDIPLFLQANMENPGALIVGSRQFGDAVRTKGSTFANRFSNFWFYVQTGRRLPDTQTGFRLYPLHKLHFLSLLTNRYEAELELLVGASWSGIQLVDIPVRVYYPPAEERVSHFRPRADFLRITLLNCVLCLLAIVVGLPLRLLHFLDKWGRTLFSLLFFMFFSLLVITPGVWVYTHWGRMTNKKRFRLHQLIYWLARTIMLRLGIPGVKFSYDVTEPSAFQHPHIIICNHQSHLDLMCMLIFTPRIVFLTNDWVWHNPFYGFLIRHAEYLPVKEGIEALVPQLRNLVERGYSIAVFPEGTRSRDCRIGRFHQGAFYLAQKLNINVLPMVLYGTGRVLRKKTYHLNRWPIYIKVYRSISVAELNAIGGLKEQARAMRHRYEQEFQRICNEIEQHI
ncbi:MAG: 1-acyl-sn-glycerol-3-phosphate acyltransferase [Prevotella sp.]